MGLVSKVLYDLGSEYVEGVNAISGERCSPHPHVYSDRLIRPGDPAFFDILHSHLGYRTCYYRTFAVGSASRAQRDAYVRCREYMDAGDRAGQAGRDDRPTSSRCGRGRRSSGSPTRPRRSRCSTGTAWACRSGRSRSSAGWCRSTIPEPLEEGMVFALETYWPAADGWSAARIEEEVVVTADGCEVITKFPAEELLVAGRKYWTAGGALDTLRESQSHLNTAAGRGETAGRPGRRPPAGRRRHSDGGDGRRPGVAIGADELLALYEQMAVIRGTEKAAHDLFLAGLVKGTTHLAAGHEAVAVGASAALRPDDYVFATYRGHHHAMARGAIAGGMPGRADEQGHRRMQGQGRLDAPDQGLGGMLGSYAIVGAHLPIAAGRRVVGASCAAPARSRSRSSATAPPTSARSTRRSTSPRSGRCRCCSSARTTSTWSTRRSAR